MIKKKILQNIQVTSPHLGGVFDQEHTMASFGWYQGWKYLDDEC